MRTVYGNHERFETTYFKKFPGYYCTGDGKLHLSLLDALVTGGLFIKNFNEQSILVYVATCSLSVSWQLYLYDDDFLFFTSNDWVPICFAGARRDADGYIWITGRIDDMVNVSGHLLSTAEVESALIEHQAVAEAASVSHPHKIKGECIYCFVTLKKVCGTSVQAELYGLSHIFDLGL